MPKLVDLPWQNHPLFLIAGWFYQGKYTVILSDFELEPVYNLKGFILHYILDE